MFSVSNGDQKSTSNNVPQLVDIVFVGAGPVGLDTARKIKGKKGNLRIVILERHKKYKRIQRLNLDVSLIKNPEIKADLMGLIKTNDATKIDEKSLDLPIQKLEECLIAHAKKAGIDIVYKQFLTSKQYENELKKYQVESQQALEERSQQEVVVGIEGIKKLYPGCKLIVGADGANSNVRELISVENDEKIDKKNFRNLIEVKYQVQGKAKRMFALKFYHTQTYLNGNLCIEHVKYNDEKKVTEITLRFFVEDSIFNHKLLAGVNAKNLLPLKKSTVPEKLYDLIKIWVSRRNDSDSNIIIGSATVNKTVLSIYSSRKRYQKIDSIPIFLVGDAACGFPYMNGLNLGIKNACALSALISQHYATITSNDEVANGLLLSEYANLAGKIFNEGSIRVAKKDKEVSTGIKLLKFLNYFTISARSPLKHIMFRRQGVFDSYELLDFSSNRYAANKLKNKNPDAYNLNNQLVRSISEASYDFPYIQFLLWSAYVANRNFEIKKDVNSIPSKTKATLKNKKLVIKSNKAKCEDPKISLKIPRELKSDMGKKYPQDFHIMIKTIENRYRLYQKAYADRMKDTLSEPLQKQVTLLDIVKSYIM